MIITISIITVSIFRRPDAGQTALRPAGGAEAAAPAALRSRRREAADAQQN